MYCSPDSNETLHSTMYLLNRWQMDGRGEHGFALHSTMYLLNLELREISDSIYHFTFHNVSIKSSSTGSSSCSISIFTFHNVSIKSPPETTEELSPLAALHSTMYLLNRSLIKRSISVPDVFTFHNVSIKSAF